MGYHKRILVVNKMSKDCQDALNCGISMAHKDNAELSILHVVHNPFGLEGWNLPISSLEKEYKKSFEDTKADLDRIVQKEKANGLSIKELNKTGEPTEEILKTIQEEKIDLLVLLANEEWRLEHFRFGCSNKDMARRMPCSTMLVKKESPAC